jgi:hypothetical protein
MTNFIYPRSPRETMCGWVYLPRFVDKIRLDLAGKLHTDYQANFTKGFDGAWLKAAGVTAEQMIEAVKNVHKSDVEKAAFNNFVLNRGREGGEVAARLNLRKKESGLEHRDDLQCFVDYIDADEKRI